MLIDIDMPRTVTALGSAADRIARVLAKEDLDVDSRWELATLHRALNEWAADWSEWVDRRLGEQGSADGLDRLDHVQWLPLRYATYSALRRAGVESILDLKFARREGRRIRGIGAIRWQEIKAAIERHERELLDETEAVA